MVPIQGEQRSPETVFEMPQSEEQSSHENSRKQRRGIAWVAGSFLFCPCHLPFTLGLLVALLSGTALGTFVLHSSLLVGAIITLVWAAGTWYGFHQLRARTTCTIPLKTS